jgi:hypothetical protein
MEELVEAEVLSLAAWTLESVKDRTDRVKQSSDGDWK